MTTQRVKQHNKCALINFLIYLFVIKYFAIRPNWGNIEVLQPCVQYKGIAFPLGAMKTMKQVHFWRASVTKRNKINFFNRYKNTIYSIEFFFNF